MAQRDAFYTVVILTESGWTVSRTFEKKIAASKWAKWCSECWDAAVYRGRPGGERVADYAKRAKVA